MKRGLYFATTSVLMVFLIVFSYNVINENQKEKIATSNFGKYAFNIIEKNIEGEKLKFFIEESAKASKEIALKKVKEKGGVYDADVSNCGKNGDYLVVTSGCDYSSSTLTFEKEFSDTFNGFLRQYGDLNPKNFDINFENSVLTVIGKENINLEIESEKEEDMKKEDMEDYLADRFDSGLDVNILDIVVGYSEIYKVPEDLVKAIIVQESGGRIDAINVNRDNETGRVLSTDHGIMQINDRAHPKFFDSGREDFVCDASGSVECNIRAGTEVLKESYDAYGRGRVFTCTGRLYTGWEAALRGYNGWGCTGNNNYVEDVMEKIGQDVYFVATRDVEIIDVGTLTVNIDVNEDINYDFTKINNAIAIGINIKNCADNGGSIDVCAARESNFDFIFNVEETDNLLKFNVEETESGDVIKFALESSSNAVA